MFILFQAYSFGNLAIDKHLQNIDFDKNWGFRTEASKHTKELRVGLIRCALEVGN